MERVSGSTTGFRPRGLDRLVDALHGEIVLRHAAGRRILDLGGGAPEIARWVADVAASLKVVEARYLRPAEDGTITVDAPDGWFDVVLCLRTLAHLGTDGASSAVAARSLLGEAARVVAPGGHVLVDIENPRSLRGLALGIRKPITVVRSHVIVEDDHRLTRYDTPARLADLTPPELERVAIHAARTLVLSRRALEIPLLGRILARAEWWARDRALVRSFGASLLVVLRRAPEPG